MFMRMYENFSGCRVLSYCVMSNHFHLLLEVPPMPEGGQADEELLKRLSALYSEACVAGVAAELVEARRVGVPETEQTVDTIHASDTGETTTAHYKGTGLLSESFLDHYKGTGLLSESFLDMVLCPR